MKPSIEGGWWLGREQAGEEILWEIRKMAICQQYKLKPENYARNWLFW